jgi:hypothetical protein
MGQEQSKTESETKPLITKEALRTEYNLIFSCMKKVDKDFKELLESNELADLPQEYRDEFLAIFGCYHDKLDQIGKLNAEMFAKLKAYHQSNKQRYLDDVKRLCQQIFEVDNLAAFQTRCTKLISDVQNDPRVSKQDRDMFGYILAGISGSVGAALGVTLIILHFIRGVNILLVGAEIFSSAVWSRGGGVFAAGRIMMAKQHAKVLCDDLNELLRLVAQYRDHSEQLAVRMQEIGANRDLDAEDIDVSELEAMCVGLKNVVEQFVRR